jgi:hypothetical protein
MKPASLLTVDGPLSNDEILSATGRHAETSSSCDIKYSSSLVARQLSTESSLRTSSLFSLSVVMQQRSGYNIASYWSRSSFAGEVVRSQGAGDLPAPPAARYPQVTDLCLCHDLERAHWRSTCQSTEGG